jgi:hypothetical protein
MEVAEQFPKKAFRSADVTGLHRPDQDYLSTAFDAVIERKGMFRSFYENWETTARSGKIIWIRSAADAQAPHSQRRIQPGKRSWTNPKGSRVGALTKLSPDMNRPQSTAFSRFKPTSIWSLPRKEILKQLLSQSNKSFAMQNQSPNRKPIFAESPEGSDQFLQSHFDTHSTRLPGWAGSQSIPVLADRIRRWTRANCRDFGCSAFCAAGFEISAKTQCRETR